MNPKLQIEKLIDHLQKQKYAFISAQGKILLHHIPTNTNHGLDILEREYYLSTGEQWRRSYLNLLWDHIPFIKVNEFNPTQPYGIDQNGTLNTFRRWRSDKTPAADLTLPGPTLPRPDRPRHSERVHGAHVPAPGTAPKLAHRDPKRHRNGQGFFVQSNLVTAPDAPDNAVQQLQHPNQRP